MTDTGVVDLNTDFMSTRRFNLNVLNCQIFTFLPSYSGLADVNVNYWEQAGCDGRTLQVIVYWRVSSVK
jgi:hypothetical protein